MPAACGGSPISTWQPGAYHANTKSHPYNDAIERTKLAMNDAMLKGILWHQGEFDSNPELAPVYKESLVQLINRFRNDLDAPELPSQIGWDSHNYITMAVDNSDRLHLAGNMHNDTLVYFRTEKPGQIATLKRYDMTNEKENRVTYPKFLKNNQEDLVFNYRNGGSGNGMRIYNEYDTKSQSWSRLLDVPLLDGESSRNAYPLAPTIGPDGCFHMVWVWRNTPDCATNHHLSYVRSKDLIHWESVFGTKVELPLKLEQKELWVDPIPSGGGIINGCQKLFFCPLGRHLLAMGT